MRDFLVRLDGELEIRGCGLDPATQQFFRREPAERVVNLHRVQARRIVIQEFRGGELRRIEAGLPAWIRPSRCACVSINSESASFVYFPASSGAAFGFVPGGLRPCAFILRGAISSAPRLPCGLCGSLRSCPALLPRA